MLTTSNGGFAFCHECGRNYLLKLVYKNYLRAGEAKIVRVKVQINGTWLDLLPDQMFECICGASVTPID